MPSAVAKPVSTPAVEQQLTMAKPGPVMLLSLAAAALTFASTLPTWVTVDVHNSLGSPQVQVSGSDAAPAVSALALVTLAAAVTLRIAGPKLRLVISTIMALAAAGMLLSVTSVATDPASATLTEVGKMTGMVDTNSDFTFTLWPWLAALLAIVLLLNAIWAGIVSRRWPVRRKYERTEVKGQGDLDEIDTWDSFSAGNDPTDR